MARLSVPSSTTWLRACVQTGQLGIPRMPSKMQRKRWDSLMIGSAFASSSSRTRWQTPTLMNNRWWLTCPNIQLQSSSKVPRSGENKSLIVEVQIVPITNYSFLIGSAQSLIIFQHNSFFKSISKTIFFSFSLQTTHQPQQVSQSSTIVQINPFNLFCVSLILQSLFPYSLSVLLHLGKWIRPRSSSARFNPLTRFNSRGSDLVIVELNPLF